MSIKTASEVITAPGKDSKTKLAAKSNFYKWHRILGLTALVPVIFWTVSGLSHPLMANWFRPFIPQEVFRPKPQSEIQPKLSLQEVMDQNHLQEIRNFSLINIYFWGEIPRL